MPLRSLVDLATMVCIKNIKALDSVGDFLPYDSVRPILLKVENAHQLRQIELNSPQIQGHTGELWIRMIERDFPLEFKANAYKPPHPDKWHRVWERYKKEHDKALEESEEKLRSTLASLQQDKEKNLSKIVDHKLLPRAGRMGPKRGTGQRDSSSAVLTFNAGSRTRTHNGASVMKKVRREVKEFATIHGNLSRHIRGPNAIRSPAGAIKAPPAMVNEYRRAAQPQYKTSTQAPEPASAVELYEKRATVISDSDEDDDPLFGDSARKAVAKPGAMALPVAVNVSLLKGKPATKAIPAVPAVQTAKPATNTPQKQGAASTNPGTASKPKGMATLASKFKTTPTKPAKPASKSNSRLAATVVTPYEGSAEPSSPDKGTARPGFAAKPATNRGPATLANKRAPTKPQQEAASTAPNQSAGKAAAEEAKEVPAGSSSSANDNLSSARTTPPRDGPSSPTPAEEVVASLADPPPKPPQKKRKAVDIFMRLKKRVH